MSSKLHFQPLLFDSFKYKSPNTTYQDHYKLRLKKQMASLNRRYMTASHKNKIILNKRIRSSTLSNNLKPTPASSILIFDQNDQLNKKPHVKRISLMFIYSQMKFLEVLSNGKKINFFY
jgi:hypothetical protein